MAFVYPIRVGNELFLRADECVERAHAVLLLGATLDRGKRNDAIVNDDSDLRVRRGRAREDYGMLSDMIIMVE